ncbi:predicted protein [Aspergillus lentulus]|nr:predicted protein [Aspergillus lentulus]
MIDTHVLPVSSGSSSAEYNEDSILRDSTRRVGRHPFPRVSFEHQPDIAVGIKDPERQRKGEVLDEIQLTAAQKAGLRSSFAAQVDQIMAGGDFTAVSTKRELPDVRTGLVSVTSPLTATTGTAMIAFESILLVRATATLKSWSSSPSIDEPREYSVTWRSRNKLAIVNKARFLWLSTG